MKKLIHKQPYVVMAGIFLVLLVVELSMLHWLQPMQYRFSDMLTAIHAKQSTPDPDIVIVDVDERSLALMAESVGRWPWPRSLHAELVEGLERQQPKAIVFDILFSDPDLTRPGEDAYFADAIRHYSNLYFPMLLLGDTAQGIPLVQYADVLGIARTAQAHSNAQVGLVLPLPAMLESHHVGTHNAVADEDGVVRRYPLFSELHGWRIPSLPAKVAQGLHYAVPDMESITLRWHGAALSHVRVSYADLYEDLQRKAPQRPPTEFKDKVVIVGATANGLHDVRATPVSGFYPGVEILASAIDNLKHQDYLRPVPQWVVISYGIFLLVSVAWAFHRWRHPLYIGLSLAAFSLLSILAAYSLLEARWMMPIWVPMLFAWAYYLSAGLLEYLNERKSRERAVAAFGRFLDPRVVQALVERGETTSSLSGKSQEISVLFSDIRGFTTLSEQSPPEQIVALLNAYFSLQSGAVLASEGTLDKYIGDAIMAFWGAPVDQPDHALRAVAAALDMGEKLEQFRQQHPELAQDLEIGIGVHSGQAVVGFIGSENRQDYTAIGDTVNLSSRIEGLTKGVARVLVSDETRRLCELQSGEIACPFEFIDRGSYPVKGRTQPVRLFEPRVKI